MNNLGPAKTTYNESRCKWIKLIFLDVPEDMLYKNINDKELDYEFMK